VAPTPGPEPRIAINATNTPGDATSLYKITAPGSYYLTGNVTGVAAKSGIKIDASNVSIDLMGYALIGVPGSFEGVTAPAGGLRGIQVRSGSIRSWGGRGVNLIPTTACRIEALLVVECGSGGITVGSNTVILGCTADHNADTGIGTESGCTVTSCTASSNGAHGMDLAPGSTAIGCTARTNTEVGISCSTGCVVSQCVANENGEDGIILGLGSSATGCAAMSNADDGITTSGGRCLISGCVATSNTSDGIQVGTSCTVINNQCESNTIAGIHATGSGNRIDGNQSSANALGYDVDTAGNFIARNTASANTFSNWAINTGNAVYVVNAAVTAGAVTGNSGGVSPGSTNPNANYSY